MSNSTISFWIVIVTNILFIGIPFIFIKKWGRNIVETLFASFMFLIPIGINGVVAVSLLNQFLAIFFNILSLIAYFLFMIIALRQSNSSFVQLLKLNLIPIVVIIVLFVGCSVFSFKALGEIFSQVSSNIGGLSFMTLVIIFISFFTETFINQKIIYDMLNKKRKYLYFMLYALLFAIILFAIIGQNSTLYFIFSFVSIFLLFIIRDTYNKDNQLWIIFALSFVSNEIELMCGQFYIDFIPFIRIIDFQTKGLIVYILIQVVLICTSKLKNKKKLALVEAKEIKNEEN